MQLDKLSRLDWQIAGSSLLLVIGLLFFPWFSITASDGFASLHASLSATDAPDSIFGVLAVIVGLALFADLVIERFAPQVQMPILGGSREVGRFILAIVTAVCVFLKFLFQIHFSYFGWGFYACVIFTVALVYSALQARQGPLT